MTDLSVAQGPIGLVEEEVEEENVIYPVSIVLTLQRERTASLLRALRSQLIPAWFARLHPRYRTPTNSIYVTSAVIATMLVLGSAGVRTAEAFGVLNDASSEFYAIAYLAMFLIPICGAKAVRERLPRWTGAACAFGANSAPYFSGFETSISVIK